MGHGAIGAAAGEEGKKAAIRQHILAEIAEATVAYEEMASLDNKIAELKAEDDIAFNTVTERVRAG